MNLKNLIIYITEPESYEKDFNSINPEVIENSILTDLFLKGKNNKFMKFIIKAFS